MFPSCKGVLGKVTPEGKKLTNGNDFAAYLLESALVAVVPGIAFGADPFFRISYATSEANLQKAVSRIAEAVAKLK